MLGLDAFHLARIQDNQKARKIIYFSQLSQILALFHCHLNHLFFPLNSVRYKSFWGRVHAAFLYLKNIPCVTARLN